MNITCSAAAFVFCMMLISCKDKKETANKINSALPVDTNSVFHADSFWIDESEVNSNEYRQFVVKDPVDLKQRFSIKQ